jgi:cbb3-type cytochrome oxidase subunit 3
MGNTPIIISIGVLIIVLVLIIAFYLRWKKTKEFDEEHLLEFMAEGNRKIYQERDRTAVRRKNLGDYLEKHGTDGLKEDCLRTVPKRS